MSALPRSLVIAASGTLLVACGTLLSLDDDPAESGPDVAADGSSDGSSGSSEAAPGDAGNADAPLVDASGDADAHVAPPDQSFLTTFELTQTPSPFGWDGVFSSTGAVRTSMAQSLSPTHSLEVTAVGPAYLERAVAESGKLTLTVPIRVHSVPLTAGASSVDLLTVACASTGASPFARVQLSQSLMISIEASSGSGVATTIPVDEWHQFVVGFVWQSGALTFTYDANASEMFTVPSCAGKLTVRAGAIFGAGQATTDPDGYGYYFDNIRGYVTP